MITTSTGAKKIEDSDNWRLIFGAHNDSVDAHDDAIAKVDAGLAIIVSGDSCTQAVPAGGYAYIKNNTHGLAEGLYKNKSSSSFPTSGGTANSTVFEAVSEGGLNALNSKLKTNDISNNITSNVGTFNIKQCHTIADVVSLTFEITLTSNVSSGSVILSGIPTPKGIYANFAAVYDGSFAVVFTDRSDIKAGTALQSGKKIAGIITYIR